MQEFLLTLVVVFVLFRLFGEFKNHRNAQNSGLDNEPKIHKKPPEKGPGFTKDEGEYTDYEELK